MSTSGLTGWGLTQEAWLTQHMQVGTMCYAQATVESACRLHCLLQHQFLPGYPSMGNPWGSASGESMEILPTETFACQWSQMSSSWCCSRWCAHSLGEHAEEAHDAYQTKAPGSLTGLAESPPALCHQDCRCIDCIIHGPLYPRLLSYVLHWDGSLGRVFLPLSSSDLLAGLWKHHLYPRLWWGPHRSNCLDPKSGVSLFILWGFFGFSTWAQENGQWAVLYPPGSAAPPALPPGPSPPSVITPGIGTGVHAGLWWWTSSASLFSPLMQQVVC